MTRHCFLRILAIGFFGCLACGCTGGSGPKVTGTVTLDGTPLADAQVYFDPIGSPAGAGAAVAKTGQDGKFALKAAQGGITLKPGKYTVRVSKMVDRNGNVPSEEDYGQLEAAGMLRNALPARYNDPAFPQLNVEVKAGNNDFPIDVKSK